MRILIPLLAVVVLVAGLVAIKADQFGLLSQTSEAAKKAGPRPEAVASTRAKEQSWESTLFSVGSIEAGRGVTVSNDSPGIVTRIHFESGDQVKAGAVLVELETSVERSQLASIDAQMELAETTLKRTRALEAEKVATTAQLDSAASALKRLNAEAAGLRAQIARKVVRAPFSGKLGIREVNVGQYLSAGSPIATLQSEQEEYVDFALPQEHLEEVRIGLPVRLSVKQGKLDLKGVVAAVDPSVNQTTRSFTVRASTQDPNKRLRPGMFVNVNVVLDQTREVVSVPVTAVVYAPFGDSVFLIEDDPKVKDRQLARQQFVRLGQTRGDFVEVEKGLRGGELIVSAGAFKLRNNAFIVVNNEVKLDAKLHPQPENR